MSEDSLKYDPPIVLFFDECVRSPIVCSNGCDQNTKFLCKHRLDFPAEIIGVDDYIKFMHFSDRQIILNCFYLIRNNPSLAASAKSGKFFIVTRDKDFLKDAQKENRPKKRNNKSSLTLGFSSDFIEQNGFRIRVLNVNCKSKTKLCDGFSDNHCTICRLNHFWQVGRI